MLEAPLSNLEAHLGLNQLEVERILFARRAVDRVRESCPEVSQLPLVVLGGGGDLETWMGFGPQIPGTLIQFSAQNFFRGVDINVHDIEPLSWFEAAKLAARKSPKPKINHAAQGCYTATPRVNPALQMLSFLHRYGIELDQVHYSLVDLSTHRLNYSGKLGEFAITYIGTTVKNHAHYQTLLGKHLERSKDYSFAIRACEGSLNLALEIMQYSYGRAVPKVIMTDEIRGYHEYYYRTNMSFGDHLNFLEESKLFFPRHTVDDQATSLTDWGYSYSGAPSESKRIIVGVRKGLPYN